MCLNTQSLQPVINFLWKVADDVLINTYQKGKYKDVILPMVVIRRLDLLLEPTIEQVLKTFNEYKSKLQNFDSLLTNNKHGSGLAFYNTSKFTLIKLPDDPKNLRSNFENYLNGFSENVQDIIEQFEFRNEINFAKYCYKHQPPSPLAEIAYDILAIEQETEGVLKEIIS
jgi:type I restriction enzyme M protein